LVGNWVGSCLGQYRPVPVLLLLRGEEMAKDRKKRDAGYEASTCVMPLDVSERSVLLTQYCSGDKIEKNEMGGACSAYGGEAYTGFWWENLRERTTRESQA